MFICDKCKQPTGPGIAPIMVPTGKKPITYPARTYKYNRESISDPGGRGWGRTGEDNLCPDCALKSKHEKTK